MRLENWETRIRALSAAKSGVQSQDGEAERNLQDRTRSSISSGSSSSLFGEYRDAIVGRDVGEAAGDSCEGYFF